MDHNQQSPEQITLAYSKLIYLLISQTSTQPLLVSQKYNHIFLQLHNLIMAREYLGRLRAYFSMPGLNPQENKAMKYYALENYNLYSMTINNILENNGQPNQWLPCNSTEALQIFQEIIETLHSDQDLPGDSQNIFTALTKIINHYYELEADFLSTVESQLNADQQQAMFIFMTIALATIIIISLSAIIIFKYLNSLSTRLAQLHQSMDTVLQTKNFALEFQDKGQDEISEISNRLDSLLHFIHALMLEKDKMAAHDPLTGIYNRNKFIEVFNLELAKAQRYQSNFAVLMLDIDHFKHVNDNYGHGVGDQVLMDLAQVIAQNIRSIDIFARWGGEEFVILTPESNLDNACNLAEKLRKIIAEHTFSAHLKITMSLGVTQYRSEDSLESMMARADAALYASKHAGRNKVTGS